MPPGFYGSEAVSDSGVGFWGFSGDVKMYVICIEVEMKAMLTDYVTEGKQINDK